MNILIYCPAFDPDLTDISVHSDFWNHLYYLRKYIMIICKPKLYWCYKNAFRFFYIIKRKI